MSHSTYIYHLRFSVIAETIEEADAKFTEETCLQYAPPKQKKVLKGWMCPRITVEIVRDPILRETGEVV